MSSQIQASVIEDILGYSGMPTNVVQNPTYNQPSHVAFGLQLPQPLKQSASLQTSYMAPPSTLQSFEHSGNNNIATSAQQSSAIRGRVMSPHVYQWDVAPDQQAKTDFQTMSGMNVSQASYNQLNTTWNPVQALRDAISSVYQNVNMLKTHQYGIYSVYKAPVENMTAGNYKYIVAIVPNHEYVQLGGYHSLRGLPWISFQTRNTDNPAAELGNSRPQPTQYSLPRDNKSPLFDKINLVLEQPQMFVYMAENMPCKVELLKQKQGEFAAQKSTIISALEAFNTVITILQK